MLNLFLLLKRNDYDLNGVNRKRTKKEDEKECNKDETFDWFVKWGIISWSPC